MRVNEAKRKCAPVSLYVGTSAGAGAVKHDVLTEPDGVKSCANSGNVGIQDYMIWIVVRKTQKKNICV